MDGINLTSHSGESCNDMSEEDFDAGAFLQLFPESSRQAGNLQPSREEKLHSVTELWELRFEAMENMTIVQYFCRNTKVPVGWLVVAGNLLIGNRPLGFG